ncbi:ABC transporter ATP-binding protein [Synechocystis sp. FACHB-383]|uniref:ABC transporter ATP-binding protein n=1 Tax=Synechocystis sp. FACHB-383 TaxID=2692864 RepID=UPI0016837622|nr:ABC transporter ATP-binding protein [Synechocystis sp. FACHB-383]MBD2654464.1 ABC transporter ATP-binding protein [Synechocystis sp. FACHB-383]
MADTVIRVENLGKKYVIGHQKQERYTALRDVLAEKAGSLGQIFSRNGHREDPTHEDFWALKDVSFEIKQGDRVGIIGRNGAGKSTLLKILSRITEPTEGRISINGRVASLLEVGTGFHPELTGRENIYLNGAILGMSKREIRRKFDEIVDFAEVEKFLDTPVKRYSSGMYVRLAFAVAAHLEPEILVVDEVLAVGDAQFQNKCLGKMEDVAEKEGRTVLFVSHNLQAVRRLTHSCILLERGSVKDSGNPEGVIQSYQSAFNENTLKGRKYLSSCSGDNDAFVYSADILCDTQESYLYWGCSVEFQFLLINKKKRSDLSFSFQIIDIFTQQPVCHFWFLNSDTRIDHELGCLSPGYYTLRCKIPKLRIYMGCYSLTTWLSSRKENTLLEKLSDICPFEISMNNFVRHNYEWVPGTCTYLDEFTWCIEQENEFYE